MKSFGHDVGSDIEKAEQIAPNSPDTSSQPSDNDEVQPQRTIVTFAQDDPLNPYCWSKGRKLYVVFSCILLVVNSTLGSSLSSGASQETAEYFQISDQVSLVLPTSLYLVGYVLAPLAFAPLSESYGRKWTMASTFALYTAFALGCALAPTWAGLNVMRLLSGVGASTPISIVGGIYADIYDNPKHRGRAMAIFMAVTVMGPLFGLIISGFSAVISWRWAYWPQLILAGVTWPVFLFTPETYGPILLRKKARQLRLKTGNDAFVAPMELEKRGLREIAVVVLTRPLKMFFCEAIVLCSCLYMALMYAIFYMFLQAYPIIFGGVYGFNAGEVGLAFLPFGAGAFIACGAYLYWDHFLQIKYQQEPPPKWTRQEEYRRVPLACFGGPFMVVSMFWLGWTARADVHWIAPVLAAVPFGAAYMLVYMALINYIVDAYEIFAASASAAASCSRSLFGVVLPFAVPSMYQKLGIAWACSLLGFCSLAVSVIPFVFIRYGDKIRANSEFCQELKRRKAENGSQEEE